jgi:thiol-disulfide isomerase/thioredoxin
VVNKSLVLRIKSCAEKPAHQKSTKRSIIKPMKNSAFFLLIAFIYFQFSCNTNETIKNSRDNETNNSKTNDLNLNKTFSTDWKTLTKDFKTWYNYTYYNVNLSEDFIPLDINSVKIDKSIFLNKLMTENVIAFKTKIIKGKSVYQLYNLESNDESIIATNKQMASNEFSHYKMEGTEIPNFNFTDLNGKEYSKKSTKGKIVILKCWFIGCVACVKEFPALNKVVDNYQGRNDIVFISLALDPKENLIQFLKTREFKYVTIPQMKNYMTSELNITQFPTHLLIDKEGKIKKVVNKIEHILPFLKIEAAEKNQR